MTAVDLGTDLELFGDLALRWNLVSGQTNLAMAIVRRLSTVRGMLYYDESYGFNLLDALNQSFSTAALAALRSQITAEVEKDERVEKCVTTVEVSQDTLVVTLSIESSAGPFELVLGVSDLSIDVLNAGQAGAPVGLVSAEALPSFAGPPGPAGPPGVGIQGPAGPIGPAGTASQSFSAWDQQGYDDGGEHVAWQFTFDASVIVGATLQAEFNMLASSASGTAVYRLYVGGSFVNMGDPPGGGTLVDSANRNGPSFLPINLSGSFTNPTGVVPVQITIQSSGPATDASAKGMSGSISG